MADKDLTTLTEATSVAATDLFYAVVGGNSRKVELGERIATGTLPLASGVTGLTTSQPMTLTQTWNNGAVSFDGLQIAITNTASAFTSAPFVVTVNGGQRLNLQTDGRLTLTGDQAAVFLTNQGGGASAILNMQSNVFRITHSSSSTILQMSSTGFLQISGDGTMDAGWIREAANVLGQRNSTNAQTFRVYNTFTDTSNYERAKFGWNTNVLEIGTEKLGSGATRAFRFLYGGTSVIDYSVTQNNFLTVGTAISADQIVTVGGQTIALVGSGIGTPHRLAVGSGAIVGFGDSASWATTIDVAFQRNAAGVVEVNSGTSGTLRDIIARQVLKYDDRITFYAADNEPPATNFATLDTRNGHPVLDYDDGATNEAAIFTGRLMRGYNGGGLTVEVGYSMTSATTGDIIWMVAFERIDENTLDVDADSFASDQSFATTTVPGTTGFVDYLSLNVSNGANMDSIAAGEQFRVRITRNSNSGSDTAAGDAELHWVSIREQ